MNSPFASMRRQRRCTSRGANEGQRRTHRRVLSSPSRLTDPRFAVGYARHQQEITREPCAVCCPLVPARRAIVGGGRFSSDRYCALNGLFTATALCTFSKEEPCPIIPQPLFAARPSFPAAVCSPLARAPVAHSFWPARVAVQRRAPKRRPRPGMSRTRKRTAAPVFSNRRSGSPRSL